MKRKPKYKKYPRPGFDWICGNCDEVCDIIRYYNGPIFGWEWRTKCCLDSYYKHVQRLNV